MSRDRQSDVRSRFPERRIRDHVAHALTENAEVDVRSNGRVTRHADHAEAAFAGDGAVHEIRIPLDRALDEGTGVFATFRLSGWAEVRYAAVGYTDGDRFRHVMIPHPLQQEWTSFAFDRSDLIARLQNRWAEIPAAVVADVRVYVKGSPGPDGARIDVREVGAWSAAPELRRGRGDSGPHASAVLEALRGYLTRKNEHLTLQATGFLERGEYPVTGTTLLPWPATERRPVGIDENPTFRYIWHSLYPAAYLALYAHATGMDRAADSAHRIVDQWLGDSFFQTDNDQRYAWYDHGTAERLVALLLVLDDAVRRDADARYLARLRLAAEQHAMLLESEAFYAANQVSRFHNHAWFQDLALLAAGAVVDSPAASRWTEVGARRLHRQVSELVCTDGRYAVFVENSIGYHHGIQSLVEFADRMLELTADDTGLAPVVQGLDRFSRELRYDDGRAPSQGDTFRIPNGETIRSRAADRPRRFVHLPDAGYTAVRGDDGHHLMFFATSLSRTHKHCDNLSFTLYLDGVEWLIDPSFSTHEYLAPVPRYLRGPWAHNAVALRGDVDYSIEPGLAHHTAAAEGDRYIIHGEHGAFADHRVVRRLSGRLDALALDVEDMVTPVTGDGRGDVVLHLGEGVSASTLREGAIQLSHPSSSTKLLLEHPGLAAECVHGWTDGDDRLSSLAGASFGVQTETTSVLLALPAAGPARWSLSTL